MNDKPKCPDCGQSHPSLMGCPPKPTPDKFKMLLSSIERAGEEYQSASSDAGPHDQIFWYVGQALLEVVSNFREEAKANNLTVE